MSEWKTRMQLMINGYCGKCVSEKLNWEKKINTKNQNEPVMAKGIYVTKQYAFKICKYHKHAIENN